MSTTTTIATDSCTFEWIMLSMEDFHRRGLLSFAHRRPPLNWLRLVLVTLILIDQAVDLTMTYVMEYDDQRFLQFGNMGRFFAGTSYRFFGTVVNAFKGMGTAYLINYLLSDYGFIREVDHKLAAVAPRVGVCRHQMTRVVRLSRRIIASFHSMVWGVATPVTVYHLLVTYRDLSLSQVLPAVLQTIYVDLVHAFLITVFIGQYYLMTQYCIALVDKISHNFLDMIEGNRTVLGLDQCLADFEVVCEALHRVNNYIGRLYLIFVLIMSILLPVILFNVIYVNINLVFKSFMAMITGYYYLLLCFMSHIAGQVNLKIEKAETMLYRELLLNNSLANLLGIKHKIFKFQTQTLHGLGVRVMGQVINLSTCITITTVYITVFSLFLGSRSFVGQNTFVEE